MLTKSICLRYALNSLRRQTHSSASNTNLDRLKQLFFFSMLLRGRKTFFYIVQSSTEGWFDWGGLNFSFDFIFFYFFLSTFSCFTSQEYEFDFSNKDADDVYCFIFDGRTASKCGASSATNGIAIHSTGNDCIIFTYIHTAIRLFTQFHLWIHKYLPIDFRSEISEKKKHTRKINGLHIQFMGPIIRV